MINLNTFTKYNKRNYLSDDWVKNLVEILSFVYCFFLCGFFGSSKCQNEFFNKWKKHSFVGDGVVVVCRFGFFLNVFAQ